MKRSYTKTLAEIIDSLLEENKTLSNGLVEQQLIQAWEEELKGLARKYTESIYIKKNILYVSLSSSVLRNELTACKPELIKKLNARIGRSFLIDIVLF